MTSPTSSTASAPATASPLGLIYGLQMLPDAHAAALEFAVALSCLKHSTYGDFSRATLAEVNSLLKDGGSGRVQR